MFTPPLKKPGRNEPCWCGSGKKYKHCHLRQDQADAQAAREAAAAQAAAQEAASAATRASLLAAPGPADREPAGRRAEAPQISPEQAAAAAEIERFEHADLEGKVAIFLEGVDEKRLTGEDVFEMLLAIREGSEAEENPDARARFRSLVERLEGSLPRVYREKSGFLLESLIEDAIADQEWDRIPALLARLAKNFDNNIEEFFNVVQALLYYGKVSMLFDAMTRAWPALAGSGQLTPWGAQEFGMTMLDANLFQYLETASDPQADDPVLTERLPEGLTFDQALVGGVITRLTADEPGSWRPADFDTTMDTETWETNAGNLLWDFVAERSRAAGVPLSRSNQMRDLMLEVLHNQIGRPAPAKKKRPSETQRPLSLIPYDDVLDDTLGAKFHLLGGNEPYPVCALMELLPPYLGFLARLGLIHPTQLDKALTELQSLVEPAIETVRILGRDARAVRNVETAWSDAALDALRRDPALAEAQSRPLVVPPPAPDPMAGAAVYRFKVTYQRADDVWFVIDISRDRTLHDLHHAIREAANFDDDHLYSFYMSGRAWDKNSEYSRRESRYSSRIKIGELPLRLRQRFLYLYDYGDEHTFEVQLIGASPEAARSRSWRVVEEHGTMPAQYGEWDEDDDEGSDEDEEWDEDDDEESDEDEEWDEGDEEEDSAGPDDETTEPA